MSAGKGAQVLMSFGDSEEKYSAEIQNVSPDAIKLWMKRRSTAGTRARIEVSEGFQQFGTVLYCNPEDIGCITVINFDRPADPRRNETRTIFAQSVTVSILGLKKTQPLDATTIDVSPRGIGLRMAKPLSIGALVKIELVDSLLFGEVRHCRPIENKEFRVGLSIEWSMARTAGSRVRAPQIDPGIRGNIAVALFRVRAFWKAVLD